MKIALAIFAGLLSGLGLYFIRKRYRRTTPDSPASQRYTSGTESGGLFFTSGDSHSNPHESSEGGADSGWGADSPDSGGGDGGGGDGGGGE